MQDEHDHHEHDDNGHGHGHSHDHGHGTTPKSPAHKHHHHGHHHHHHGAASNLKVALFLNLGFALIEAIGGIWTGSVAILADAVHDLGDGLALGLAYGLERMAGRTSDAKFSYGYRRLSLLSAIITGAFLLVGSCVVLSMAIPRLLNPTTPKLDGMLGFAFLGMAVNGYAAWRLMHGSTMNERMVSWHLLEDVFGWVTVFFGTIAMKIWDIPIIDPIMSIVFSLFIFRGVFSSLRSTVQLFLQATPEGIDLGDLRKDIGKLAGVLGTHDAHLWSLDGESHVLTIHVVVAETATVIEMERIKGQVRSLASKLGKIHTTVELESDKATCPTFACVQDAPT